ncbi:hypothetical protein M0R45_001787 [Rubus argutus]|uniref:Uncharacterized protein n=1 Tax=Rubus argutus TaxID=59490 RepID=A0AAW1VKS8_RUBAR
MKSMDVEDSRIEYIISSVKQQLFELHEAYKANVVPLVPTSNSQANLSSTIPSSGIDLIALPPDLEDYAEEVLKKAKTSSSTSSAASSDLQYYIDMPILETADGFEFNLVLCDLMKKYAREQYREQEEDEDIQNIKLSRPDWMIAVEDAQRDVATGVETIPD